MSQNHPVGQLIIFSQLILSPSTKEVLSRYSFYRQGSWGSARLQDLPSSTWWASVGARRECLLGWVKIRLSELFPYTLPALVCFLGTALCEIHGPTHAPSKPPPGSHSFRICWLRVKSWQLHSVARWQQGDSGLSESLHQMGSLAFTREQCVCPPWEAEVNMHLYLLWTGSVVVEKVTQSCPTICNPMDYTVHGILQARILGWVTFPFSRGSSQSSPSLLRRRFCASEGLEVFPGTHRVLAVWVRMERSRSLSTSPGLYKHHTLNWPHRPRGWSLYLLTSVRRKLSWKGVFMVTREQKSKNMMQRNLFTKTEIDSWTRKTNLWLPKGNGEEG